MNETNITKIVNVLSLGAGVQSTTLYLMACEEELRINYAVFADTQDEPGKVYDHLGWLRNLGGPPILEATKGRLGDDLMRRENSTRQRFASIPAFTAPSIGDREIGWKEGKVRRQCTREYKIDVVERVIRRQILGMKPGQRIPPGVFVIQYFGISTDEARRAKALEKRLKDVHWSIPSFPLLSKSMTRGDCHKYLEGRVPYKVPRSACVFCPYKTNMEWRRLRDEDPEGWARATEVDEALRIPGRVVNRNMEQELYLHRSCMPLVQVDLSGNPETLDPMTVGECEGMCGV